MIKQALQLYLVLCFSTITVVAFSCQPTSIISRGSSSSSSSSWLHNTLPRQFIIQHRVSTNLGLSRTNNNDNHHSQNTSSTSLYYDRNSLLTEDVDTMKETSSGNFKEAGGDFTVNMPFFGEETDAIHSEISEEAETPTTSTDLGEGLFWRGVVAILCALWASNFAAGKLVMAEPGVDSSLYALARFSVALLALMPGSINSIRKGVIDWETAKGAAVCGSWVAFGYLGQTLGLLTTTASRSCVISTLHCVFVAAVAEFMRVGKAATSDLEKSFDFMRLLPAAVAVLGVAIVEIKGAGGAPNIGDLLSFAQPIGFGMGYLQLEELVRKKPDAGLAISAIKLVSITAFSFAMFEFYPLLQHEALSFRVPDFMPIINSHLALGGILYTGLITTAASLWIESIAFKRVPATDASIILTTEPLFAALFGALTLGETFGASDYFGAALIIGACALAVLLDNGENPEEEGLA